MRPQFLTFIASGLIFFSFQGCKDQQASRVPPPNINVTDVVVRDVDLYKEFVGQVYGQVDIPIRARVSGFLEGIHFQEGRRVFKGDLLYSIDEQPFQAEVARQMSTLTEAKTALVKTESDLNRIKPLAEINAVSQSDLDAAQAQYDAAIAYVEAANASLNLAKIQLSYCKMYAPINGVIGKTNARVGEFVGQNPNPVILNTVSTIESVRVEFFLSESDYLNLSREVRASGESRKTNKNDEGALELILSDGSVFGHRGEVDFIDRQVDPTTGTILIQGTFPNPDRLLRPGLFARIRAKLYTAENAILVPQRCVSEIQGKFSAYKVGADNIVKFQQIELGATFGDYWRVTDGLNRDDVVVLEGLQQVRDGMEVVPVKTEFESKSDLFNK